MKKNKIKTILILIIIIVLCLSVGAYAAYVLSATEVSYTKSDGTTVSVKEALDELRAGVPAHEIGDEVTVGGEQFYVLEWDNNSDFVRLISKYCVNSGLYQVDVIYGKYSRVFDSANTWEFNYMGDGYNLNNLDSTNVGAMGEVRRYGGKKNSIDSELMTLEEATGLVKKAETSSKIARMIWGEDSVDGFLRYWLGTSSSKYSIYCVDGSSKELTSHQASVESRGVRPVVTFLKSRIE